MKVHTLGQSGNSPTPWSNAPARLRPGHTSLTPSCNATYAAPCAATARLGRSRHLARQPLRFSPTKSARRAATPRQEAHSENGLSHARLISAAAAQTRRPRSLRNRNRKAGLLSASRRRNRRRLCYQIVVATQGVHTHRQGPHLPCRSPRRPTRWGKRSAKPHLGTYRPPHVESTHPHILTTLAVLTCAAALARVNDGQTRARACVRPCNRLGH